MIARRAYVDARQALLASDGLNLCAPFVAAFPVTGAAMSVLAGPSSASTVCASDAVAGRLDEIQFDVGEGPCWSAMWSHAPVLRGDIRNVGGSQWPAFTDAMLRDTRTADVGALFAFPLNVGSLEIGAIDLYAPAGELTPTLVAEAAGLADIAAWQVLKRILTDADQGYDDQPLGHTRREVHQATGMMIVQLGVSPEDAQLLLRAHAYSTGRSVQDVANDVVERRLDFTAPDTEPG